MIKPQSLAILLLFISLPIFGSAAQKKKHSSRVDAARHSKTSGKTGSSFEPIDAIIDKAVGERQIPGAVLLIGHKGKVLYRKAYGDRSLEPRVEPMTLDTIFDVASLTKVIATTSSVMRMFELGQVRMNDPIARYIPEFGANGKQDITIRELMTHYSGLAPDLDLRQPWSGKMTAFEMIVAEKPQNPPGAKFVYSDINYEMLGFLVERISGMTLDQYAAVHFFQPLKMGHTSFLPPAKWLPKIAPTEYDEHNRMLRGVVHDPTARRMGGVSGHAGLFSTADDLSKFAQELLSRHAVLNALTVKKMSTPQQPPTSTAVRGLGWDLDSPFSSNRGELIPVGSFGHTGFTGTSIWIDPYTNTYIILLVNGVHPHLQPGGAVVALRTKVATAAAAALKLKLNAAGTKQVLSITGYNEAAAAGHRPVSRNGKVLNGIDVLEAENFKTLLAGQQALTIGLLINHTSLSLDGRRTVDILAHAPGVKLSALFAPEHGAVGALDTANISDSTDAATGIKIYSVYGSTEASRRPPQEILKKLDAVVIDIQDVGARYYTYETSLGYFLEEAAKANVQVFVLDRPNPITGTMVQGPVSDTDFGFVNYHAEPLRHGMTMGELAQLFNGERKIGARLTVVPMQGWQRGDWFDSTGQMWINPSPNMRDMNQATLYTGIALVEGTNVSVGRGSDTPFEMVGAPWVKARELADYLNQRQISGVRFVPTTFTPQSSIYAKQLCQGVNIIVTDRIALDAPELGVEMASALLRLYPNDYRIENMIHLLGNQKAFESVKSGVDPRRIEGDWLDALRQFEQLRTKYLIYQ